MKMYIAKCFFGNKVIKFRTQAYSTEGLEPTANAIAMAHSGQGRVCGLPCAGVKNPPDSVAAEVRRRKNNKQIYYHLHYSR